MRRLLYVLPFLMAGFPAQAEWKDKNTQINQTNFIVMEHGSPMCSATLISLKYKLLITANHCLGSFIDTKEMEETNSEGMVKKVKREVLDDVTVTQKAYQGFRLVGDASYQAVIVAHQAKVDMGLLQLRADTIPQTVYSHVPEKKNPERGDRVYVVGNPLGMLDATLTAGIVSSTTRMMKPSWADEAEVPFLQVDASINGGNSGGALYNDEGELIGIPDAGFRGANGLGLTLTAGSIRDFLKAHCYEDVYKDGAITHDACVAEKKDAENKRREKAGLPPLKE